jgi:hypothetical protein
VATTAATAGLPIKRSPQRATPPVESPHLLGERRISSPFVLAILVPMQERGRGRVGWGAVAHASLQTAPGSTPGPKSPQGEVSSTRKGRRGLPGMHRRCGSIRQPTIPPSGSEPGFPGVSANISPMFHMCTIALGKPAALALIGAEVRRDALRSLAGSGVPNQPTDNLST